MSEIAVRSVTTFGLSADMSERKGKPRKKRHTPSGDPQPSLPAADEQSDGDIGALDEKAYDDALDGSDPDDMGEDGLWEALSPRISAAENVRLRAELAMLQDKFASMRFDQRAAASTGNDHKLAVWKPNSLKGMAADTPSMDKPGSVLLFRRLVFDWLGAYSFVLRLFTEERKMLTKTELLLHRTNRAAFLDAWTPSSLTHLHHDVYMELKRHLSRSILVAHIFTQVTTEHHECAAGLWDALLRTFHPRSHQVIAAVIAEAASVILQGPDPDTTDPDKAFRKWDAAVSSLHANARDLPSLDPSTLAMCLMIASMHASKEESYYQAYFHLQPTLALPSATLNAHTIRTAAVNAFNTEQRRRSSASRAPDSVLGFAAAAGFRRPPTGTSTPAPSCCRCPHHCVLPDGTFRPVRHVEAQVAAVPARESEADVSEKTLRAYRVYKAAIDGSAPHADIERLSRALKEERQSDRERARYYRMQEEEEAVMAIAAARDYDSDE